MNTITKHNRYYYLIAFFVATSLMTLVSCRKNLLDTVPQTTISDVNAYTTPEKIAGGVYDLYKKLQSAQYYGGKYILYNELRGEEFGQNDGNANVGALIWGQNPLSTSDQVANLWSAAYASINSANLLIANVSKTTVVASPLREQYVAEAKFVRALNYFALVQTFARPYNADNGASLGVPLRLIGETSTSNNDLARSTVAQVYTQIIKDMNDAETDLPAAYTTNALNASRAHKATAIALKTRVYLAKGDYDNVITEAKKIVPLAAPYQYTSGTLTHKLEPNIASAFTGTYVGGETLFSILFNTDDSPDVQSALGAYYYVAVVSPLAPAGILSDPALSGATSTDARKALTVTKSGQKVLIKFPKTGAPYTDYIAVIRYAEVLLNYAEASAEKDDLATATLLLNAVRKRSDPTYTFAPADIATKAALIPTILKERRIELLGEGLRTPDLQRRLQPLPSKTGAIGTAPAVPVTASNYIWPIPSSEISTNKLAQPNP
jgi:hypothetical protein